MLQRLKSIGINHLNLMDQHMTEREYPKPVKPHPGAIPYDWEPKIFTSGDPHPNKITKAYEQWFVARQTLIQYAHNIIKMRKAQGVLRLEHGVNIVLYGICFTYAVNERDFRSMVVDSWTFLKHLAGILKVAVDVRKLNNDFVKAICDLESQPDIHINHVNPNDPDNKGKWA